MIKQTMNVLLASSVLSLALLTPISAQGAAEKVQNIGDIMKPYQADYVITRNGSEYGEGYRYLEVSSDGEWQLRTKSDISWFILSDTRKARSVFVVDTDKHYLEPKEFIYERTGTGSDKSFHGEFKADEKTVRNVDSGSLLDIDWKGALFDEANVTEQLRIDLAQGDETFKYRLVDEKGKEDEYRFRVMAKNELLSLPYGELETVKVERVRDSNRRQTFFWFAPELNYVMVKMQQFKEGDEQATLSLKSLDM